MEDQELKLVLSPFSPAFLADEPRSRLFLSQDFRDPAGRSRSVEAAARRRTRAQTVAALTAQATSRSPARLANLAALGAEGTVAVVTGQQVGLFLGPLYAVYKAATAVAVARTLESETGRRCVPVFWLQTEDHDLPEIDHCHVLGAEGWLQRLEVPGPAGNRRSISELRLGPAVTAQLDLLATHLAGQPHLDETLALFGAHYRPEATWSQAFAGVLSELFADDGLVLLDPRDPALAVQVRPVHERAVRDAHQLSLLLLQRTEQLEAAGYAAQVHVKADAPLSFFHPEGPTGPRVRLEPGATFDRQAAPHSYSTSALLRPIVQDTLLPTAAIVGGPGELNYFAQLAPLYAAFSLPMPMVMPRARFRVIDPRTRSLLDKLRITAADAETPTEALLERVMPHPALPADELERRLVHAVGAILDTVPSTDADVLDALKRTRGTVEHAFSRLGARYARSLRHADEVIANRVERVQAVLFPNGEPQERVLSLPSFTARLGVKAFMDTVRAGVVPFSTTISELT